MYLRPLLPSVCRKLTPVWLVTSWSWIGQAARAIGPRQTKPIIAPAAPHARHKLLPRNALWSGLPTAPRPRLFKIPMSLLLLQLLKNPPVFAVARLQFQRP